MDYGESQPLTIDFILKTKYNLKNTFRNIEDETKDVLWKHFTMEG